MDQGDSELRSRLLGIRLPAMPQILLKLMEQCQTENAGMAALAELIAQDPGMASKILGVANSSAYHRDSGRSGLEKSLMLLGSDMIKTLVISESVFQVFNSFTHGSSADLRGFWKHSLTTAVMAREIACKMAYPQVEEAYLAGLLHNVGRLALLASAPKEYAFNFLARDDEVLCTIEQRTFNISHCEAGASLIERWQLDSFLADSVLYHHEAPPRVETAHPLIRIVVLANLLCNYGGDDAAVVAASSLCALSPAELEAIGRGASAQVARAAEYLGIDLAGADEPDVPSAAIRSESAKDPAHQQLTDGVRDFVLIAEIGRAFSQQPHGESGLLESITRSARMLFGFDDAVIFLMNTAGDALVGFPIGEPRQRLSELSIALSGGGVLADAARQRKLGFISRSSNPLAIAEEQLLHILSSDSLVCLPLVCANRCLGVLVGGVALALVWSLQPRARFLMSFGEQAASALAAVRSESGEAARQIASISQEYRQASRRVVHEVNNPLSIIKNYLAILDAKLEKQEPVGREISILNEEIDRVGQIINELVDANPAPRESGCDVNRVIGEVVRFLTATDFVPASVQIVAETAESPCEVDGGSDALKQILINLIKNSLEAMPAGGAIHIASTGQVNRDGRPYIELTVKDSGPGLPPEVLANLFTPGASSKGEARGLGLCIVHELVKKAGGFITCRSGGKGTAFEMLFPVRQRAPQMAGDLVIQ